MKVLSRKINLLELSDYRLLFTVYKFTVDEFTVTLLISLDCGEIAVNTLGNLTTEVFHPD